MSMPETIYATPNGRWFSRLAERTRTSAYAYRLIVDAEREQRRSLEQNSKMWAMLTEFANQYKHAGRYYEPERWKAILLHAWGQEIEFLPSLDGNSFIPYGNQSSKMLKRDMVSFLEFIMAEGAKRGVKFADDVADHAR